MPGSSKSASAANDVQLRSGGEQLLDVQMTLAAPDAAPAHGLDAGRLERETAEARDDAAGDSLGELLRPGERARVLEVALDGVEAVRSSTTEPSLRATSIDRRVDPEPAHGLVAGGRRA